MLRRLDRRLSLPASSFIDENGGGSGVRLRKRQAKKAEPGSDAGLALLLVLSRLYAPFDRSAAQVAFA